MKPMFRVFSFTVLTSTLLFSSCVKDLYDPEVIAEKNPDAEIPVGFKFTTTKSVNLTVNVDDQYNGANFYMVEVYNQNPLASNNNLKLLTAGVATGRAPYVEDIVVSQSDSVLYIKQIDPLQREVVMIVDVTSATTAICDFSTNSITTKSTSSSVVNTRAIPASADRASDYKLPVATERTTLTGAAITLAANTKYYLPEGVTNNQITFPGGQNKIELYVAGSTTFSGQFSLTDGCKIVVLPKGKVTADSDLNWYGQNIVVAIHEGGTLNLNASNSKIGVNTLVINDGTLNAKNIEMGWNNPKIVNNGTLNSQDVEVTNGAGIQNNNLFNVRKLTGNSTTKLENNGEIKATEVSLTNKFVIDNNHHMEIAYLNFGGGGGTLNNNCFTVCDDLYTEQGTINSASGSLLACKDFWGNNSTITLKGNAIFSIGDVAAYNLPTSTAVANGAVFNYHVEINGAKESNLEPLFYIKSGTVGPTSNFSEHLSIVGSIEAAITPAYDSRLLYKTTGNVKLTKSPQAAIAETSCNGSGATEDPGTGTPTNPSFPIKVETGNEYTFAMEDNWPALGDYDMNDFVFTIDKISYSKGNNNKLATFSFEITPVAAGASYRLALGVQFDKIASGSLSLVSSSSDIATKESGQEKANLILLPDVYRAFGLSSPGITNTYVSKPKYTANTYKYEVSFNNSVSESDINISNLNFYLIVGQINDVNRKEIHLAGYKPTSRVKSDPLDYTDYNNMVWGLLIPTADFKYPIETVKIQDAYPNFLNWAKSGGANNPNWYLSPQSGKVYDK